ncbi:MAG: DUF4058 family protein [bacterium]|nr:DUF4058 family protein [bacterium]
MMPQHSLINPYQGINAHLHSLAQNPAENSPTIWTSVHAMHIVDLVHALNVNLPPHYVARPEQSLQIWTETEEGAQLGKASPRPDAAVYPTSVLHTTSVAEAVVESPARVISLKPYLEREITIPSAVIYTIQNHEIVGSPVTRIELLSASNKRGGIGHNGYTNNRWTALLSGTSLVELDYLHQSASPLPGVPPYPEAPDSHAYAVGLTDRRPVADHDLMLIYDVNVDQPLPTIQLPLAGSDSIAFDLNTVYQHTYSAGRWGVHINYALPPRNVESYSPADQARIQAVMKRAQPEASNVPNKSS